MTSPPVHPVLIVNPRSGGGKAARRDLVTECRSRGIEPIVFEPGDDLAAVAHPPFAAAPMALGIDGESVVMEPPLLFESSPNTMRVRVAARRPLRPPVPRPRRRSKGPSALPANRQWWCDLRRERRAVS